MRIVPAGRSRKVEAGQARRISSKRGRIVARSRCPASVAETLRVVRVRSRMPRRSSNKRIDWLRAEGETPSWAAALVAFLAGDHGRSQGRPSVAAHCEACLKDATWG